MLSRLSTNIEESLSNKGVFGDVIFSFFEKWWCLKESCPSQKPRKCMLVSMANLLLSF